MVRCGKRGEMAKQGALSKKPMASKSFDTMSPDVLEDIPDVLENIPDVLNIL